MTETPCANRAVRAGASVGLLIALAAVGGCSETDDRPFAWGYISPVIFQPSCATSGCHSRAVAVAGLDFSDPDRGYASLTGGTAWVPGTGGPDAGCKPVLDKMICPGTRALVVPYDPAQSRVVNMLRARGAPRMPPDRPLAEADIRLVERWILDGARRYPDQDAAPPVFPTSDAATDADDGGADGPEAQDGSSDASGDASSDALDARD